MIIGAATVVNAGLGVGEIFKVFVATLVVVAIILGCAWCLRRTGTLARTSGQRLQVTAARSLGGKARLVVVEFEGVQLLLGATPSSVTVLHKAPVAKADPFARGDIEAHVAWKSRAFSARFVAALRQNAGLRRR